MCFSETFQLLRVCHGLARIKVHKRHMPSWPAPVVSQRHQPKCSLFQVELIITSIEVFAVNAAMVHNLMHICTYAGIFLCVCTHRLCTLLLHKKLTSGCCLRSRSYRWVGIQVGNSCFYATVFRADKKFGNCHRHHSLGHWILFQLAAPHALCPR